MYHYSVPPPGYVRYNYNTSASTSPSSSPSLDGHYTYFIPPQYKTPSPTTTKNRSRKDSYTATRNPGGWHSPAGYPSPTHYQRQPDLASPPAKYQDYVSNLGHAQGARRYSMSASRGGGNPNHNNGPRRHASVQSQKQRIIIDTSDEADDSPYYNYIKPRTGHTQEKYAKLKANNHFFYNQVPAHAKVDDSRNPRSRRPSESRPSTARSTKKATVQPREATAADAARYRIPAGYSLKNWDPTEAPVMLLGSVFDANSLGKWIYDWTVFHHGPATPMSEVAGDLWLLLIKLAGKMKRADECLPRIEAYDNQDLVEDFLESGDRLWARFKTLLKACEEFMWRVAKKEGARGSVTMGKNSGCEFVDSIFGRDRKLEETESLMQGIRLWNMRFDANCESILRRPSAA